MSPILIDGLLAVAILLVLAYAVTGKRGPQGRRGLQGPLGPQGIPGANGVNLDPMAFGPFYTSETYIQPKRKSSKK